MTRVDLAVGKGGSMLGLRSSDLSKSGLATTCKVPPQRGSEVHFGMQVEGEITRGRGAVVWAGRSDRCGGNEYMIGIRFLDLDPDSARRIGRLVDERLEDRQTDPFLRLWTHH